jgi:UDP-N-acetylglucosamine 2-epimerase (non-hydrolysing)
MDKCIVTITGIRPDFIRMANIFKKLDDNFNHILIHTGQHYDKLLSDVFFQELEIRRPDYILDCGSNCNNHYEQLSYLSTEIINLFKKYNIKPDIVLFLGDSNSVTASLPLKKEGYKIGHIEAGMRSGDKRMLEEINRTVCDHCSDLLFVYHNDYRDNLYRENIVNGVYVVGNTIVEVCNRFKENIMLNNKRNDMILIDIHRPENFKYENRLRNIIKLGNKCIQKYNLPVKMLKFHGTCKYLKEYNIDLENIELIDLLPYNKYLDTVYHCQFIISDSGTGQEEPALLGTKVLVPRDYTERPQSVDNKCSIMVNVNTYDYHNWSNCFEYLDNNIEMNIDWLGDGITSDLIIKYLNIL